MSSRTQGGSGWSLYYVVGSIIGMTNVETLR